MNWIVLISGTGREIMNLSQVIQKTPSVIITNKIDNINLQVMVWIKSNNIPIITLPSIPTAQDYQRCFDMFEFPTITLHGYMRILPVNELMGELNIYNGHPGLIDIYPQLRGKDPQKKAFDLKMSRVGSVVHRVVQEVDSGEIVCRCDTEINSNNLDDYYIVLRKTSLEAWIYFFTQKLYLL